MTSRAAAGADGDGLGRGDGEGLAVCAVAVSAADRACAGVLEISLTNPAMTSSASTVRAAMKPIAHC